MRDSTKISNDVRAVREELAEQSMPKLPARARLADSIGVISGTGGTGIDERRRQILLAAMVVVLVVLSFFAGRL